MNYKLKYKHAIMFAKMAQPYLREFYEIREQADDKEDEKGFGFIVLERLLVQATDDMTELIASVMEVTPEEVGEVEFDVLFEWFEQVWEQNNLPGFIERAQGLMKNNSQSQLQNLSNASTAGPTKKSKK